MAVIERRLPTMTAATPEGVTVLLRVGGLRGSYSDTLQDRYLGGRAGDDPPPALDPVLWRALVSIERQTGFANGGRESSTAVQGQATHAETRWPGSTRQPSRKARWEDG